MSVVRRKMLWASLLAPAIHYIVMAGPGMDLYGMLWYAMAWHYDSYLAIEPLRFLARPFASRACLLKKKRHYMPSGSK